METIFDKQALKKADFRDPAVRQKMCGAVQYFIDRKFSQVNTGRQDDVVREITAHVQNFGADNFPDALLQTVRTFYQTPPTDGAWTALLDVLDYTGSDKNGFTIDDVADGLSFNEVPVGQKAKLYSMAGERATVTFNMYGGGLGWHRTLTDDREFWTMERKAQAFVNKWVKHRNDMAYDLLNSILTGGAAAGSVTGISWQAAIPAALATSDANYVAVRDMQTISYAAQTLILANNDKGYGVTTNSPITLMFPLQLRSRILRALGMLNAGISGSFQSVQFPIVPVMSESMDVTTEYIMGIPGQKNLFADRMRLTVFDKFDPASYSDAAYGWGRFAGAIGDFEQLVRCATA